jgi:uncharacterized protein (TIGR03437 family)
VVFLTLAASSVAAGQIYSISTLAGGGLPVNIPATSTTLNPGYAAADKAGDLFFVNQYVVLRMDSATGVLTLAAGNGTTGFSGDGGPATSAQLYRPAGVAVDSAGALYIADAGNQRVRKVANGVITTVAGNGLAGYSGDGGPATSARLNDPVGLAVDSAGNLYIADVNNSCVRKVANGVITTVAGNGVAGFGGDNGPATTAQLNGPYAVAVDAAGNLYISDALNQRIRKVAAGIITTIAGNGTAGFSGDNGPAVNAQLATPLGLSVDAAGNLYFADRDNQRVRKVTNGVITTIAGNGTTGFSGDGGQAISAEFSEPVSVALDAAGALYITDDYNYRIRKIASGVISTVAGGGVPTSSQFGGLSGIAVDSAGSVYVGDQGNHRVLKVANGTITTTAGNGTKGFSGDGGSATAAQLNSPYGVAVDSAGNLYIADSGNNRVRQISNGVITTVAGNGTQGFSGDNGPALSAELNYPIGVAVDSAGSVYVADANNYRVRKVSKGSITTVAGNGMGNTGGTNVPATSVGFSALAGIAVDASGNLYIADDTFDNAIRKVTNGIITTIAGGSAGSGFGGDNGPAVSAQLGQPTGVAVDSDGNVYLADSGNQRVRKVVNGMITTIAGNGTAGFSGDGGPAYYAELNGPWGVAVDSSGNVYVADGLNGRIRLLTPGASAYVSSGGVVGAAYPSKANSQPAVAGSLASAYGSFLVGSLVSAASGALPTSLGGVSLEFSGGLRAPLMAVSGSQINFQVPWELAGQSVASVSVLVAGQTSEPGFAGLAPLAPGVFSTNGQGTGQGAILDASYRLVDSSNPATAGVSVIQIYCTGLGPVTNQPPTGLPPLDGQLSETITMPSATIGGAQAQVLFSGLAPGTVGIYQVNALVPPASAKGEAVPVTISFGPFQASNGSFYAGNAVSNTVTIAVQ